MNFLMKTDQKIKNPIYLKIIIELIQCFYFPKQADDDAGVVKFWLTRRVISVLSFMNIVYVYALLRMRRNTRKKFFCFKFRKISNFKFQISNFGLLFIIL